MGPFLVMGSDPLFRELRVGFHSALGLVDALVFLFFADSNAHERFNGEPGD